MSKLANNLQNIKLTVAYDGTAYLGWQKTAMGSSIEQMLEQSLSQILQEQVTLQAASRTDAGVHATGQIVNFFTEKQNIQLKALQIGLNALLPKDISVLNVEVANGSFHPTVDCLSKEYHYHLCYHSAQLPQHRFYSWHFPRHFDINLMRQAASLLIGEHDFSAFCNFKKNSTYAHYIRNVSSIHLVELPDSRLRFEIRGNNFLYKMVRNLVGTLVYVGCGKIDVKAIPDIIESKQRPQAGVTAPAHGLCLQKVYY